MTDELARVIIVGIAGWRIAALLSYEEGPWGITAGLRRWLGVDGEVDLSMLSCVWCLSPYAAVIFWGLWEVHWYIPGVAAAAGIVVMAERWVNR